MSVYIRRNEDHDFLHINNYIAYAGFRQLGTEIQYYSDIRNLEANHREDIIVGGIGEVRYMLDKFNQKYPTLEYPESIAKPQYLGRRIWKDVLGSIVSNPEKMGVFIKPVAGGKLFTGTAIQNLKDLRICAGVPLDTEIWCSDLLHFVSEYRCFIRYGEVLGVKHYHGDFFVSPSKDVLMSIIEDYKDAPNAYSIDLGITDQGETFLVEINDGYALGSYGLEPVHYAKLLATRWAQLTSTKDAFV